MGTKKNVIGLNRIATSSTTTFKTQTSKSNGNIGCNYVEISVNVRIAGHFI